MAQTISIFSTKGGVGRTFIAVNLAVSLAVKFKGKKILLLDMDSDLPGDMARLLNLKPQKVLNTLLREGHKEAYSSDELKEYIIRDPASGLDFATFTLHTKDIMGVHLDSDFLSAILENLAKEYDFIIADNGRAFNKLLISFLERTNLILLVTNPDMLSVSQAKEAIETLQSLYFPLKMIKVILNRAESLGGVTWREVKTVLPCDIIARIPSEGKVIGSALNRQVPVILDSPRSRASAALNTLAEDLTTHYEYFIPLQELEGIFSGQSAPREKILVQETTTLESLSLQGKPKIEKKEGPEDKIDELKQRIHRRLIQELDLRRLDRVAGDMAKVEGLRERTIKLVSNALAEESGILITSREERERIIKEIVDEALGLGPLEDLINDEEISDILVNNKNQIYVEKRGKLQQSKKRFVSNEQVRQIIERIVAPLGRRIDESMPMVDARLADGSRVNAIIPPLSLTGPTLTIRKFGAERLKISDLERLNAVNDTMAQFLKACVLCRKNVIVSGGTGSGKTTVLNVLSEFVPDGERIITIEDAAELKLHHEHWIRLESRPPNIEGKGAISVRDLFRNSLRMRPDRIIIGECRGPETLDMLQAMNTGHDGSMTTLHANSTQDVLSRLDSLILMSGIEIPLRAIREMIASSIDVIVHTARLSDGSRKVTQITEITGMLDEVHIGLHDIFAFHQVNVDERGKINGNFEPTGAIPTFFEEFHRRGIPLSADLFKKK
ncbi:MAG: ATPase, T2SS/T4P/T4SS family [Candidatus Omnitrophica bacterium]|nr:ATPase, T2SS/T4P/T4SS family [Candidatus Omnitrophota bacterium]MDD5552535.1 ATPase, T2SS/T4P/T4SS family [Candidatus Omnitrophota bacterium]